MVCCDLPGFSTSVDSNEPLVLFKLKTRIVYSCFFESEKKRTMHKQRHDRAVLFECKKVIGFVLLRYTTGFEKGAFFSSLRSTTK